MNHSARIGRYAALHGASEFPYSTRSVLREEVHCE
jgi:hypothetical protein